MTAVLEAGQQLQCLMWQKEEAKNIEQRNRAKRMNIVEDQLVGEGWYSAYKNGFNLLISLCSNVAWQL